MSDDNLGGHSTSVLVVCTANQARSPIAEVLLDHALRVPGLSVSSAGVRAREGVPAADYAIQIAAARKLDLTRHRSRLVTPDLVAASDLILTMSERQRDHCAGMAGGAGARSFTLREFHRLLDAASLAGGPVATTDRLKWLRGQAHAARPIAVRPRDAEDIADPINEPWPAWQELAIELDGHIARIRRAVEDGE